MITPQSVFNAAWQRFIVEKRLPCIRGKSCAYEHNGNNCAVGAAMSPEQIEEIKRRHYNDEPVSTLMETFPEWFSGIISGAEFDTIQRLLHDSLVDFDHGNWRYSLEERENRYRELAAKHNLTIPT